MATYLELFGLYDNDTLLQRIEVGLIVRAQAYLDGASPTAQQRSWAYQVFQSPRNEATRMLKYLLAKNAALTTAAITGVTDTALQTQIDAVAAQFVSAATGG